MTTATLPRKIIDLNRKAIGINLAMTKQAVANTTTITKVSGRGAKAVAKALRTAGRTVVDQSRSAVERTVTTAKNGTREVAGQVKAQRPHVGDAPDEANRTADSALRAASDKPSSV